MGLRVSRLGPSTTRHCARSTLIGSTVVRCRRKLLALPASKQNETPSTGAATAIDDDVILRPRVTALCASPAIASSTAGGGRLNLSITMPSSHPRRPDREPGSTVVEALGHQILDLDAGGGDPLSQIYLLGRTSLDASSDLH